MYLYELWNLRALQLDFLAPRSLSEQSSRNSGPVSERAAVWESKKISHYKACAAWPGLLPRSAAVRKDSCKKTYIRFISAVRSMVRQATLASRSTEPRFVLTSRISQVKLYLNINEKHPGVVWPLAITVISQPVTIKHELGNRLTQQRYVHGKYKLLSRRLGGDMEMEQRAAFLLPPGCFSRWQSPPPQRKPPVFTRRVTGSEKRVYCTGVSAAGLVIFTASLRPCWDWRNNKSKCNAEFKTKLDKIYKVEHTFIIIPGAR